MDENQPGYQTILSQLVAATTGRGVFYYLAIFIIFIVLTYSAQTSFVDFPRVCRLLAADHFLPHFFAERGRRLVFSFGIIILAIASAILLIIFKGITTNLIPLFAVGAFSAFLFSQVGMVVHWAKRKKEPHAYLKIFFNGLGAISTFIALVIIIFAKFVEGAWIVVFAAPLLAVLLILINKHYKKIRREIDKPLELQITKLQSPAVIIPIYGWNCVSEKAVRFGLLLSDDVTAVNISSDNDEEEHQQLKKLWAEKVQKPAKNAGLKAPNLTIIYSPYRTIYKPLLDFVNKAKKEKPDRLVAVVIPELIEAHWYENLLHNIRAAGLRTLLFLERDQRTVVITTPWYLR
jgi:4-amino-4-deoxy-L-arabinose transferase-like glycosyltransferase